MKKFAKIKKIHENVEYVNTHFHCVGSKKMKSMGKNEETVRWILL